MSGYSTAPLIKKLGLRENMVVWLINAPPTYRKELAQAGELHWTDGKESADFIHLFATSDELLSEWLPLLRENMKADGIIWISWPKRTSSVPTDINREHVRQAGLSRNLVDIKVCAIDDVWSGLKFVIPKAERPS
jgi:type II secretory pathway component PulL